MKKIWTGILLSLWKLLLKKLLIMKVLSLLLLITALNVSAAVYSQDAKFNISIKEKTLIEAIKLIEKQSNYRFFFSNNYQDLNTPVSLEVKDKSINEVLSDLLSNKAITYKVMDNNIVVIIPDESGIQQQAVTGRVTDSTTGEPIIGANIVVDGTTIGTVTDVDGKYSIQVPAPNSTITISFIGYTSVKINLTGQTTLNVQLVADIKSLEEVVVVGYGTQKKLNLTAAVDQVTSEALENRPISNLTQGLQGVMPNLNIKLLDGKPNQSPSYNIRGTTSIGQGGSALILIDGVEGDPSMLNPNDIASVSMLKDAASASIYGARGAFGVVLITTKNPAKGKTSVNFSTNYSMKSPVERPDFVTDGYTWVKMFSEAFVNGDGSFPQNINKTMKFSQAYLDAFKAKVESGQPYNEVEIDPVTGEYVYYGSTDFYDELYKKNLGASETNLSITGSGEKTTYLVSARYMKQNGLFRYNSDDYNMKNFRGKGSVQAFPWLKIENNADYSEMFYHNPMNVGEGGGIWRNIADEGHPASVMFNPDGSLSMSAVYGVGDFWYGKNGIDTRKQVFTNTTSFTSSFFHNVFRVKGDFTLRNTNNKLKQKRVQVPYSNKPGVIAYVGTTTNDILDERKSTQYLASNLYAEFEKTIKETHYLKVLLGTNYEESTYNRLAAQRNGIIYEDASDLNLALGQSIVTGGGYEKWAILGGFSRINYSYKDRYLIEVNARYDGSSKFPSNQRYAFFPSVSGGWRLSKESFWNVSPKIISDVKFRASYGSLGNGNIGSYIYQEQFSVSQSGVILNGVRPQYTSTPTVLPDGLTWETSTTTDIGFDFSMMNDRLSFVGDYYVRNTTDMFTIGLTLPATFGATAPKGNYADLQTKGWEASLVWRDMFNISSKPFSYNIRLTMADNKSVIKRYNNPDKLLSDYYEGQTIGEIWGYETEGFFIDQADIDSHAKQSPQMRASPTNIWYPGDIKLKDINNDGFVNIGTNRVSDPGDRKIIGNKSPRYTYGISLSADWNNFFFSTFFQGVGKQDWYPSTEAEFFWGQYNRPYNNIPKWHLGNMWTPENTNAYFPRTMSRAASNSTSRELGVAQTKYLQNIAYIRMKNIQIGYSLPKNLISKIGASDLKIYFSGENLWTYSPLYKLVSGLDVENTGQSDKFLSSSDYGDGYNYPMLQSLTVGINVIF